ncbi:MAG: hypothetical protein KIS95_06020 [Anaerolineae bacterium]|uniref:hypothetical protein n=1 Tax=Promineifilum sp. TaxID=2664178 RepID=UPI001D5A8983|nr:hypothetical protein [Anaerolineales bacterium]MCB8934315.1 hypothetical protein [Promineifilum sp.]MCO5179637.1 hypothetical protein [Promineifilum sp.]MCW5846764.1 hypothetical protein [Anaerolineae bacterium]
MKQYALRAITLFTLCLGVGLATLTLIQVWQVQADGDVPALAYLGESGTFSVGEGYNFIVKTRHPFGFMFMPGPEYSARDGERVWSVLGDTEAPAPDHQVTRIVGQVQKDCVIDFATIDDDEDERINYFKLDGNILYTMGQGLTTRGRFVIPHDGVLSYEAVDSIGMFISVCDKKITPTPTMTLTPTATLEPTFTPTPTLTPTMPVTPTATITGTVTVTITATPVMTPTATATSTPIPLTPTAEPDLATPTPSPSPTPTREPRLPSCLRINFDVSGQEARRGLYVVQEVGGRYLAGWEADDGWKDSGWFYDVDITFPAVYVDVFYYHGPGATPVRLAMWNPAPDSDSGWLGRGTCHALEVGWP